MGQIRVSSIAIIKIARSYANRILQELMDRIIDILEKRKKIVSLFCFKHLNPQSDLEMF